MKHKLRKILLTLTLTLVFITNVNAMTIKEDASKYSGDVYIIGSSRFDGDVIVTGALAGRAGARETYIQYMLFDNYEYNPSDLTVYYYSELDESWFELPETNDDEIRSLSPKETAELTENLNIYYVNDEEKIIEFPYNVKIEEGQKLIFSSFNPTSDDDIKYEKGTLLIPSTVRWLDTIIEKEDGSYMYLDTIEQIETVFVNNTSVVNTLAELKSAISEGIYDIRLGADITEITETITIPYEVYFNGAGHTLGFENIEKVNGSASGLVISGDYSTITELTIQMDGKEAWQGNYALQIYDAEYVSVENYTGTKADAALLVNSSKVLLNGTINVTGNEYGGIEVSKGTADGLTNSTLEIYGIIEMDDEAINRPVMWIEKEEGTIVNYEDSYVTNTSVPASNNKEQTYFYTSESIYNEVSVTTVDELKQAASLPFIETIILANNITDITETITLPNTITFMGSGYTLGFKDVEKVNGSASGLVISGDDSIINDLTIEMDGKEAWQGNYALQVYNAKNVVINNYTGTKADAALLVNSSDVTLEGDTNVTGNEYGGIEVSKGTAEGLENSTLTLNGSIIMDDEAINRPVMWIEKEEGTIINYEDSYVTNTSVPASNNKEQTYFYTSESIYKEVSAVVEDNEETVLTLGTVAEIIVPTDATAGDNTISSGDELTLTVEPVATTPSGYTITSGAVATTYDISIVNQDGEEITDTNGGITVKFYVGEASAIDVKHIVNGVAEDVEFTVEGNYIIFKTSSFSPFVIKSKYVAKIGNVKYDDLQTALDNAKNGEKIVLLSNIIYTGCDTTPLIYHTQNENINATLDLNGKIVTATVNNGNSISLLDIGSENANKYTGTATFTIEDSSSSMVGTLLVEPTISSDGWDVAVQVVNVERLGRLTVESGNIIMNGGVANDGNPYGIKVITNTGPQTAELTINGGYIESKSSSGMGVRVAANSETGAVKFTMNGGTIVGDGRGVWLHHMSGSGKHQLIECTINGGTIKADRALEIADFNRDTDVSDNIKVTFGGGEFISTNNGENPSHPDYPELFSSKNPDYYNTTFSHVVVTDNR